MLKEYHNTTFTHHYAMGSIDRKEKMVYGYLIELSLEALEMMFSSVTDSRGYEVVRYSSNKKKVAYLEEHCIEKFALCDLETFESSRRIRVNRKGVEYKENRGEYFEYLVAQKFKVEQNDKANLKHTEGGDIEINGIAYQVKYEGAGIATGRKVR
jgi:hypothetical protein